jgi:hypothetical protein
VLRLMNKAASPSSLISCFVMLLLCPVVQLCSTSITISRRLFASLLSACFLVGARFFLAFCSLSARFLLAFCSVSARFLFAFCSLLLAICLLFALFARLLLAHCSLSARFLLAFCPLSSRKLVAFCSLPACHVLVF